MDAERKSNFAEEHFKRRGSVFSNSCLMLKKLTTDLSYTPYYIVGRCGHDRIWELHYGNTYQKDQIVIVHQFNQLREQNKFMF